MGAYDEIEARLGDRARIRRKGSLIVHPDADTWAQEPARLARLREAGVEGELLGPEEVRAREPALTGPLHGASFFPRDLQCAPREIARALAEEVPDVRREVDVRAIAVRDGRVTGVQTADGRLPADDVVLACGPWSAALAATAGLALPLEPRKGQLVRLTATTGAPPLFAHKVIDGSYLRSVASLEAGLQVTTVMETTWEGDVLVGSSRERRGFDLSVDPAVSERMLARAARLAPAVRALPIAAAWSGLRPWLPDHLPAIGPSTLVDGLWLATGHEGAGVGLGPITGKAIAQCYVCDPVGLDLTPFAPDRFARVTTASH
jgi:glycine/D-amino acid oxidase-like deaminating enzyme